MADGVLDGVLQARMPNLNITRPQVLELLAAEMRDDLMFNELAVTLRGARGDVS
jgi:hypothetical protein